MKRKSDMKVVQDFLKELRRQERRPSGAPLSESQAPSNVSKAKSSFRESEESENFLNNQIVERLRGEL